MNKRGFIGDVLTILVGVFTLSIVVLVMVLVVKTFNDDFQAMPDAPAEAKAISDAAATTYPGSMDFFVVSAMFGLPIVSAALVFFLDVSAMFIWIIVIISFLYVLVAAALAIGWDAIINSAALSGVVATMPMTTQIMNNYALYALYAVIVIVAGMFFRMRYAA